MHGTLLLVQWKRKLLHLKVTSRVHFLIITAPAMTSPSVQFSIRSIAQDDRIAEANACPRANLFAFTTKTNISARNRQSSFSLYVHSPLNLSPLPHLPVISTPATSGDVGTLGSHCHTLDSVLTRARRSSPILASLLAMIALR